MGELAPRPSCEIVWQIWGGEFMCPKPELENFLFYLPWPWHHECHPQRTHLFADIVSCWWQLWENEIHDHVQVKPHATVFQYHRPLHKACQGGDLSRVKELCQGLAEEVKSLCLFVCLLIYTCEPQYVHRMGSNMRPCITCFHRWFLSSSLSEYMP